MYIRKYMYVVYVCMCLRVGVGMHGCICAYVYTK